MFKPFFVAHRVYLHYSIFYTALLSFFPGNLTKLLLLLKNAYVCYHFLVTLLTRIVLKLLLLNTPSLANASSTSNTCSSFTFVCCITSLLPSIVRLLQNPKDEFEIFVSHFAEQRFFTHAKTSSVLIYKINSIVLLIRLFVLMLTCAGSISLLTNLGIRPAYSLCCKKSMTRTAR